MIPEITTSDEIFTKLIPHRLQTVPGLLAYMGERNYFFESSPGDAVGWIVRLGAASPPYIGRGPRSELTAPFYEITASPQTLLEIARGDLRYRSALRLGKVVTTEPNSTRLRAMYLLQSDLTEAELLDVPQSDNVAFNRKAWNMYAKSWDKDAFPYEDAARGGNQEMKFLGDEWGSPAAVDEVLAQFVLPYVEAAATVGELAVGGGRIASRVAPRVAQFVGFDISEGMLEACRRSLGERPNVRYELLEGPKLPETFNSTFDFIYCFDAMVHMDLHTIWAYLVQFHAVLRPGRLCFIHTSNITAPKGWLNFSTQKKYNVLTHYPLHPETVRYLLDKAGFDIVKEGESKPDNFYLNRDALFLARRRG
jgi:SAM-dependent methyltransferase